MKPTEHKYYKEGNKPTEHKGVMEPIDKQRLDEYFDGWRNNAVILQQLVWYELAYVFGFRGREGCCVWVEQSTNEDASEDIGPSAGISARRQGYPPA